MELVHGGDWAGYRAEFGRDALDFSVNVSPLGLPAGVAAAIAAALPTADRYPDPLCRALRAKLAAAEGVDTAQILCGNGAADLIYRLALAVRPRRALLPAPTFAEYAAALETVDCDVQRFLLRAENDFAVTDGFIDAIDGNTDAVFLCQPNNPTGQVTPPALVEKLLHRCADCGPVLVVDECFGLLPARDTLTAKTVLRDAPNLIILKAFTKLYAMAGMRLGYALCSDAALLDKMRAAGQPWAVSGLAQAAGLAALEETAYADSVRTLIADQRPRLAAGLRALGLRVIDGQANYLLFKAPADFGQSCAVTGGSAAAATIRGWTRRGTAPLCARQLRTTNCCKSWGGAGMSRAKCIMVQGTMSGAGKSLLCAALCRIFAQDGYKTAPFKSQNMALNSFVTRDGLEMGRAQVVQAQAAGVEPDVRMNPILLKPSSDIGSQVIVNGEVRGDMPAKEYFRHKSR